MSQELKHLRESEGEEMGTVNVEVTISAKDIVNNLSSSELVQFIIDLDSYSRDYEAALRVFEYFAKEVSDHEAWQRAKGEL